MEITVICDFDGTITTEDIGDMIIDKFASDSAKTYALEYYTNGVSSMDVDTVAYASIKQSKEDLIVYAKEKAIIRDGFFEFLDFCKLNNMNFIVISGGYDYYIKAILGEPASNITIKSNSIAFLENGEKKIIPKRSNPNCIKCGNCKSLYCDDYLSDGNNIIYIGDSLSDVCAVQKAQYRFARHRLKDILDEMKVEYNSYDTFFNIINVLKNSL